MGIKRGRVRTHGRFASYRRALAARRLRVLSRVHWDEFRPEESRELDRIDGAIARLGAR